MNQKDIFLLECLKPSGTVKTITVTGLFASAPAFKTALAVKKGGVKMNVAVFPDIDGAEKFTSDLYNFLPEDEVFLFPSSSDTSSRNSIQDASRKVQRTSAIQAMDKYAESGRKEGKNLVIVACAESVAEPVLKRSNVRRSILKIGVGEKKSFDEIKQLFFDNGFIKREFVSCPGEFAVRGGLMDVFSYSDNRPYRIDFFSDQVERITEFDNNTQLSVKDLQQVEIYPDMSVNTIRTASSSLLDTGQIPSDTVLWLFDSDLYDKQDWFAGTESFKRVLVGNMGKSAPDIRYDTVIQPAFNKNFDILSADLEKRAEEGYRVEIISDNHSQIERLTSILKKIDPVPKIVNMSLSEGFIDNDDRICRYTDHQIFERFHKVNVKRQVEPSERLTIDDLSSFRQGDYVVHINYGIGIYEGIVRTTVNGREQEAIKLVYKDGDVLLVSVNGIHRISKYKSGDGEAPKINKLGSKTWQNLKERTKSKVKDIAKELITLYGQRSHTKGFAFSADTYMQEELESSFMYEDTPDQAKASRAVKEDMERPCPMDRLVCGDVGFGKTEVAIRAAFKAVSDNKQVAVLVPTTILALQHYKTFTSRLRDFPCTIDYLSRMRSPGEVKQIAEDVASGKTEIIIGTHRLLNKQIHFKDLGLLIIDEEQKFGVSAKERLRQLKSNVDTLTLTATPIPRTLQFSLMRARDLSIINTPPPNRIPIHTELIDFDEDRIRDAVLFEMKRGGQVFFLHNRVENILAVADMIHRIAPQAKVGVAHGQMDGEVLEQRMIDFIEGDYDVLVCTSIIENGLDIPNANTIIIDQAQNFGLSDLHQLRGRVGRSNRQAFCYLITPDTLTLTDEARRRLQAIESFSDLGSGFNIAMQDLDIRGAGNLLGAEQSGFIADMGFETYKKIIDEALDELRSENILAPDEESGEEGGDYVTDCTVDTDLELFIPDDYVNVPSEKIRLYKELDSMPDEESIRRFVSELEDRYGKMPQQVCELIGVVRLRHLAQKLGFEKIVLKSGIMVAYFISNSMSPYYRGEGKVFDKVMGYIQRRGAKFTLKQQNDKLYFTAKFIDTVQKATSLLEEMLGGCNV